MFPSTKVAWGIAGTALFENGALTLTVMPRETMLSETMYEFAFQVNNLEDAQPFQVISMRPSAQQSLWPRLRPPSNVFDEVTHSTL